MKWSLCLLTVVVVSMASCQKVDQKSLARAVFADTLYRDKCENPVFFGTGYGFDFKGDYQAMMEEYAVKKKLFFDSAGINSSEPFKGGDSCRYIIYVHTFWKSHGDLRHGSYLTSTMKIEVGCSDSSSYYSGLDLMHGSSVDRKKIQLSEKWIDDLPVCYWANGTHGKAPVQSVVNVYDVSKRQPISMGIVVQWDNVMKASSSTDESLMALLNSITEAHKELLGVDVFSNLHQN